MEVKEVVKEESENNPYDEEADFDLEDAFEGLDSTSD